jgi:hypothetical protein
VIVGEKLEKAVHDTLALQDISMTLPKQIGRTRYHFIQLKARDLTTPMPARLTMRSSDLGPAGQRFEPDYSYEYNLLESNSTINIIFLKMDGSDAHLLLNRKGFIATADIPSEGDTSQRFSIYRLSFEDTDNDGRLTRSDRFDLYVADLFGNDLRQITDSTIRVTRYLKSGREGRILLLARLRPSNPKIPETDWIEKLFVYDVKSHQLSPFVSDESLMRSVRRMLWSK